MGDPQNGWFIEKILLKWMIWGIQKSGRDAKPGWLSSFSLQ